MERNIVLVLVLFDEVVEVALVVLSTFFWKPVQDRRKFLGFWLDTSLPTVPDAIHISLKAYLDHTTIVVMKAYKSRKNFRPEDSLL